MIDRDPRPVDPGELGINNRALNPTLLRDERGRIRWTLPGNTPEQNLLIGIKNVQIIFLEKFPEFSDLYLARSEFQTDRSVRLDAKGYILQRIGRQKQVFGVFGHHIRTAPYFNGSTVIIAQQLLKSWDIPFSFRDFKAGKDLWSGKTEEEVIKTMQDIWLEEFPDFLQSFPFGEDGKIMPGLIEGAKKFILMKVGRYRGQDNSFLSVFGGSPATPDLIPYFNGSHIIALKKIFRDWGIKINITDFPAARLWTGKSKEEALDAVREIFLARFPNFKDFFIDGQTIVDPNRAEEAAKFIISNILPNKVFHSIFRGAFQHGSPVTGYLSDIAKDVFGPWGIVFKLTDLPLPKNIWRNKTESEIIIISLTYFKERFPDFEELLAKKELGDTNDTEIQDYILNKLGTSRKCFDVFPAAFQTAIEIHFNGSYSLALKKIFAPYLAGWGEPQEKPKNVIDDISPEEADERLMDYFKEM